MGALKSNVTLQLGLISVPVNIETAVDGKQEVSLNTLCVGVGDKQHAPARTKQDLKCPTCENADKASFVKGKDNKDGTYTLVAPEDIAAVGPDASVKGSMALTVHPVADLADALPGGKVYYLSPGKTAGKVYGLLSKVVQDTYHEYAYVCEFAVRSVSALYRIGLAGDCLVAQELAWPESIKARPSINPEYDEPMLPMAKQFVETLCTPFDANLYRDKRTEMLAEMLAKAEAVQGGDAEAAPGTSSTKAAAAPKTDLMASLQAAVEAAKAEKAPVKKAPAKKAAAKAKEKVPA